MNHPKKGNLYLIPTPLGDGPVQSAEPIVLAILDSAGVFIVENERSARRFLRKAGFKKPFEEVQMLVLDEHSKKGDFINYLDCTDKGIHAAIISEAGCPGIADPGADVVALAHSKGVRVIPLVGACSIVLALMASGMNGQSFAFCGYLPRESDKRKTALQNLERKVLREHQTQVFIETPYRNDQMLSAILAACSDNLMLCVAADLTLQSEQIISLPVREWKKKQPVIGKKPAVFILG